MGGFLITTINKASDEKDKEITYLKTVIVGQKDKIDTLEIKIVALQEDELKTLRKFKSDLTKTKKAK